jgi:hypothetical protein
VIPYTLVEVLERREAKRRARRNRRVLVLFTLAATVGVCGVSLARGEERPSVGHESDRGNRPETALSSAGAAPTARVTIAATGDIAMGRGTLHPPDGGATFFDEIAPSLRADVVVGNLETPLASAGTSKCEGRRRGTCFAFRAPPSYARRLKEAGFTVLNLANNHVYDHGFEGAEETVAALNRFRLRNTGRAGEIALQRVHGVRVAILGFAPNGNMNDLRDLAAARQLVDAADARADLVVVTMHAGAEGPEAAHVRPGRETHLGEDRGDVVAFAHTVVEAGADLVVGHGPHVLRGMEWYRGRLVAYSLGNFAGYRNFRVSGPTTTGAILRATLRADGSWVRGRLVATRLAGPGIPTLDANGSAYTAVRSLSREDFGDRGPRVSSTGLLLPAKR